MISLFLFAVGVNGPTIAVVVFILCMVLWFIGGTTGVFNREGGWRVGGSIIPWLAVASLAYLAL